MEFGWRQLVSVGALVLVVLGLLPVAGAAAGGRWGLPSQGVEQPLGFLSSSDLERGTGALARRPTGAARRRVVGRARFGLLSHPEDLPDTSQVLAPAGPGPAALTADAVRLALAGGTVHLGRLLAPAGVRYVVVVDGLAPSEVGTATPSVAAPPPAGLQEDLLEQNDLEVVPGEVGVQVYQVSEGMPVTGARGAPLPPVRAWSYPAAADVVGWQPVLGDLSPRRSRRRVRCRPAPSTPATRPPGASRSPTTATPRRASRPSGGLPNTAVRPGRPRSPLELPLRAPGGPGRGGRVDCAADRARRPSRRSRTAKHGADDTHGGQPRRHGEPAHRARELRWRILLLVVVVLAGVAIVADTRGTPTAPAASAAPAAVVSAPNAESSAWYCTGQSTAAGPGAGFPRVDQQPGAAGEQRPSATVSDGGASARTAVSVPAHGVATPSLPAMSSGSWQAETVTVDGGGVTVSQVGARYVGLGRDTVPEQHVVAVVHPERIDGKLGGLYLSLFNPTATPVVVDLSFMTPAGSVHPVNYQGIVLAGGLGAGGERGLRDPGRPHRQHRRDDTDRARRGLRGAGVRRPVEWALAHARASPPPQAHWTIPQAAEASGGTSAIEMFNPGDHC